VVLGLAQSAAIVPGISRSGTTICALLFRGIEREKAFKFSMLASLPALFGAIILEGKDISMMAKPQDLAAGFLASLAVGLLSLFILKLMVQKAKLYYFGYYCIIVAVSIILFIK
jgi:undecaprenyl-diphosphatase